MFQKIESTQFPPRYKPVMVWDGKCGFCKYWVTRWKKITKDQIDYKPFQEVAHKFEDIDLIHFKQASRLIEKDGTVYSGPRSAYRTLTFGSKWAFLDRWYENKKWFANFSDRLYNWVAKNRSFMFKVTRFMFGSDPDQVRPFWVIYLGLVLFFVYSVFSF